MGILFSLALILREFYGMFILYITSQFLATSDYAIKLVKIPISHFLDLQNIFDATGQISFLLYC